MDTARERLAQAMDGRRIELGMRWTGVARAMGMSVQNLARIRDGKIAVTKEATAAIERALHWGTGSVEAVLADGSPTPLRVPTPTRQEQARSIVLAATRDDLVRMANAYAEVFGEEMGEAFLLRAAEIRAEAADERASGLG